MSPRRAWVLLIGGILLCQAILFWPSLSGRKILAPTDLVVDYGLIGSPPSDKIPSPSNALLLDAVEQNYPFLNFAAREIRAGRLPLWNPYSYCGSPFLANPQSSIFSPFAALYYLWPDPKTLAWIQPLQALIGGIGLFLFLRRLGTSPFAAAIGGICFPIIGFNWLWLTFWPGSVLVWLPWALLSANEILRKPIGWGGPGLAFTIALIIHAQHLQTALLCLLVVACFGIWQWTRTFFTERAAGSRWRTACCVGLIAALSGLALGAIKILPAREYLHSSFRIAERQAGYKEEPTDFSKTAPELLRLFLPYAFGDRQNGSHEIPVTPIVMNEGGGQGYVGLVMLGLLAPIAVISQRRDPRIWFWVFLALCGAAPMFHIPILHLWSHLPPFDLGRSGRALLITAFAGLILGVKGIDELLRESPNRATLAMVGMGVLVSLICCVAFVYAVANKPQTLIQATTADAWPWFRNYFCFVGVIAGIAAVLLAGFALSTKLRPTIAMSLGIFAALELLFTARNYNPQVDRQTFYPERDFIRYLQTQVGNGRFLGLVQILYPNIGMMYDLRDVRGYDAVDPTPYVQLLRVINQAESPHHSVISYFVSGPSPILDLLSVRYIASPESNSGTSWEEVYHGDGVWVYRNPNALGRVFVPNNCRVLCKQDERCQALLDPLFNPREVAIVNNDVLETPTTTAGTAEITNEIPTHVTIRSQTESRAIVVLADAWSDGWHAVVDGKPAEAFPVDEVLRGVAVPAGEHRIDWDYRPRSVQIGASISAFSLLLLFFWSVWLLIKRSRSAIN